MKYSSRTNGFYNPVINSHIPDDAIDISDSDYNRLLLAQSCGASLIPGKEGYPQAISDGKIIDLSKVTPESIFSPPPLSLKEQAQNAMQQVQQQASMVTAMGETFGPDMQAYVKTLRAIIKGTDTTSSTLPILPEDPTD